MSHTHRVTHGDNDFFMCQNYVLQMVAEKKISQPAFILYCFYKSTNGFPQINYSFEYISKNCGISKGSISKGLEQLEQGGLIEVIRYGANKTFDIKIVPGENLPRRTLQSISRKGDSEYDANPEENFIAQEQAKPVSRKPKLPTKEMRETVEKKFNKNKNFDPSSLSKEAVEFWHEFIETWKTKSDSNHYPKNDMYQLEKIKDFDEATKLIPVMWVLDERDEWTKNSDHTLSVFVHLLEIGKLQSLYPQTSFYYRDKQKNES